MAPKKDAPTTKTATAKEAPAKKEASASAAEKPSKEDVRKHMEEALARTKNAQHVQHDEFGNKNGKTAVQHAPKSRAFRHQGRG